MVQEVHHLEISEMKLDYNKIFKDCGFRLVGTIGEYLKIMFWWHDDLKQFVEIISISDRRRLLRSSKSYYLIGQTQEGITHLRDLPALADYLRNHFPEICMTLYSLRDLNRSLVRKKTNELAHKYNFSELQNLHENLFNDYKREKEIEQSNTRFLSIGKPNFVHKLVKSEINASRKHMHEIRNQAKVIRNEKEFIDQLEGSYLKHGSAISLSFSISSNIQFVTNTSELIDGLNAVIEEIRNTDRYQIKQKLNQGKLQVFVSEINHPQLFLHSLWTGSSLNPNQLERYPELDELREAVEREFIPYAWKDIVIGGKTKDQRKSYTATIVRTFLKSLPKVSEKKIGITEQTKSKMPVWTGKIAGEDTMYMLAFDKMEHVLIIGMTGSGKSIVLRVLAEGCCAFPDVALTLIDVRGHMTGILFPEKRTDVLDRYNGFGLEKKDARGFDFTLFYPARDVPVPSGNGFFAKKRSIVCLEGLDEKQRLTEIKIIFKTIFERYSRAEAEGIPRHVIYIDESHLLQKKFSSPECRKIAEQLELIDSQIIREGRKYGIMTVRATQKLKDSIPLIRANTSKIFLRCLDTEAENVIQYSLNQKEVVGLKKGQAIIANPDLSPIVVDIRPPLSSSVKPSEIQLQEIICEKSHVPYIPSRRVQEVVDYVRERYEETGRGVRLTEVMKQLGITSKRKIMAIIEELKQIPFLWIERLNERGNPLFITLDEDRTKGGINAD